MPVVEITCAVLLVRASSETLADDVRLVASAHARPGRRWTSVQVVPDLVHLERESSLFHQLVPATRSAPGDAASRR